MSKEVRIREDLSFYLPDGFRIIEEADLPKYFGDVPAKALFLRNEPDGFLAFTERSRSAFGRTEILLKAYQEAFAYELGDFVLLESGISEDEVRVVSFSFQTKEDQVDKYRIFGAVILKEKEVLLLGGCDLRDSLRLIPSFRDVLTSFRQTGEQCE